MFRSLDHWRDRVRVFDAITATALTIAGSAVSAVGTIAGGNAAAAAGQASAAAQRQNAADNATQLEFRATQEDQAAQESRASSQRDALEKTRQARLLLSTLQARAASGGGGASDPTILNLAGNIGGRGEYEALTDMFTGEDKARGLEDQASGDRYSAATGIIAGDMGANAAIAEGNAKRNASYLSAAGTLIGGAGSAYKVYNLKPRSRGGYG
jgi:hypothetical protein